LIYGSTRLYRRFTDTPWILRIPSYFTGLLCVVLALPTATADSIPLPIRWPYSIVLTIVHIDSTPSYPSTLVTRERRFGSLKTMNKGTTQGRRFSRQDRVADDYSHDGFGSKGSILEVGSAYLFEKPRSGIGKMPRFSGSLDCTSNDDDDCNNNAYCDSGTCYSGYISDVRH
jgi:hypothetical protein